jgi:hypothetical protein
MKHLMKAFRKQQDNTIVTLCQTVAESLAKRIGAYPGWLEMLDHLSEELARQQKSIPYY